MIVPHTQDEKNRRSCTLLFPGLLGPDAPLQELSLREWPDNSRLPNLLTILKRGRSEARPQTSYEQLVLAQLGVDVAEGAELPVAGLRANAAQIQQTNLWCLDPAYVELDREGATLTALDALELSTAEAAQLIDSINQHFAADNLSVTTYSPQQWLLQLPLQLHTHPPSQVLWRHLGDMLPSGADAGEWRRLLNEMQMLLHAHPVNQARMERGRLPVNSLWLWGGGELVPGTAHCDRVYANDDLVRLAAAYSGLEYATLPDGLEAADLTAPRGLLVCNAHLPALMRKDVYAWFAALEQLEQAYLVPMLESLNRAELDSVTLLSDTVQIVLTRRDLRRWRFGRRNLAQLVLGLRGDAVG